MLFIKIQNFHAVIFYRLITLLNVLDLCVACFEYKVGYGCIKEFLVFSIARVSKLLASPM